MKPILLILLFATLGALPAAAVTLHSFTLKAQPLAADEIYIASAADSYGERRATITSLFTSPTLLNPILTNPVMTTPTLGVASATSINGLGISTSTGTLTIANGKTLTASNTLTFTGADASSIAFGTGGTVLYTGNNLSVFAATTSAQLAGVLSDETGSGAAVYGTSPTLVTPVLGVATATSVAASGALTSSSPTAGIGYTTGAGGTVVQGSGSGKATAVTLNANCGTITLNNANLISHGVASFVFNNTAIAAGDLVVFNHDSVGTIGAYTFNAQTAAGSATVTVTNVSSSAFAEAIVVRFAVIKAVSN